jgi:hypothetical protein
MNAVLLLLRSCCVAARHLHLLPSLLLLQRTEVIEGFVLTNFETGETHDEHPISKHMWVIEQMQLSQEQKLTIVHAMDFFQRMLAPTIEERQRLQQDIAQQKELLGSSSNGHTDSSSSSKDHKQLMAKREAMLTRLSSLLRKEYLMRMAACAAIVGALTYVQVATAAVQMTPQPFSLQMIGMLLQQEQQQQQQQQHEPAIQG